VEVALDQAALMAPVVSEAAGEGIVMPLGLCQTGSLTPAAVEAVSLAEITAGFQEMAAPVS